MVSAGVNGRCAKAGIEIASSARQQRNMAYSITAPVYPIDLPMKRLFSLPPPRLRVLRPGRGIHQGPLHQVRVPHPDARRQAALHLRLRAQGRLAEVPDHARPHAVQRRARTASTTTRPTSAPPRSSRKEGFIFVYQDVRGRYMSEGEFVNMRPHIADKAGRRTSTRAPTPTTPSTGWSRTCPTTTATSACGASPIRASTPPPGMIDAHPALKAASPQAPITDWFIGDDFHHNGALYLPHAFRFFTGFGQPRPEPTEAPAAATPVRPRHAGRLQLLPRRWARWPTSTRSTSRTTSPSGPR